MTGKADLRRLRATIHSSVPARAQVYDKFRLDLSDEQAVQYFDDLMVSSTSMIMPKLVEAAHTIAQYLRK